MSWPNAPAGPVWYAEPLEPYDVRRVPFSLLIDPDGRLLGHDLRGYGLDAAIARAFRQSAARASR
ncbi:MAG: hypothetical protein JSV80_05200 [Acidobacteriota bacterium]|nr:MAG: hypothetical protein JSV80_05200 [Acidobacteriota bacterium]